MPLLAAMMAHLLDASSHMAITFDEPPAKACAVSSTPLGKSNIQREIKSSDISSLVLIAGK